MDEMGTCAADAAPLTDAEAPEVHPDPAPEAAQAAERADAPSDAPRVFSKAHLLQLSQSPLVYVPEQMVPLKEWYGYVWPRAMVPQLTC